MNVRARMRDSERDENRHKADEVAPRSGCGQEPPRRRQRRAVLPARDGLLLPERVGQLWAPDPGTNRTAATTRLRRHSGRRHARGFTGGVTEAAARAGEAPGG